jgi:hypothetical protein
VSVCIYINRCCFACYADIRICVCACVFVCVCVCVCACVLFRLLRRYMKTKLNIIYIYVLRCYFAYFTVAQKYMYIGVVIYVHRCCFAYYTAAQKLAWRGVYILKSSFCGGFVH